MRGFRGRCAGAAFGLLVATCAAATSLAATATRPATRPTATSIPALRSLALTADPVRADEALAALEASADAAGRDALARVLPQLVARESATIARTAAAVGDLQRMRAVENELAAARREAWDNLAQFGRRNRGGGGAAKPTEAIAAARRHHDQLAAVQARLRPIYAAQVQLAEAVARRGRRAEQWRRVAPDAAKAIEEETARLATVAEAALGGSPERVAGLRPDAPDPPEDTDLQGLWLHVACRGIEAYNRTLEPLLDPQEVIHAARLNAYRELLGILPLELDARLIQSARRHSKEMIDLWYFSHFSPTESQRTAHQRMRNAGYDRPANENIHLGRYEGAAAFWKLFDSPGHHWTMVRPQYTALGVGRWDVAWTEHFGGGPRLMHAAAADDRARAGVLGDVLPPQASPGRRSLPAEDARRLKTYDRWGREQPLDGGGRPKAPATRPA